MRLFIAAKISPEIESQLEEFLDGFMKFPAKVKWVTPRNIHLTLKFLGETDERIVENVKEAIAEACSNFGPIDIQLKGCGAFPNLRAPRVFWVGIVDHDKNLAQLATRIDQEVHTLGFERERRAFSPHLTLGRVKDQHQLGALNEAFGAADFPSTPLAIKSIYLIQSHLKPTGPVYHDLEEFEL